jgi:hypothetical protein
MSFGKTEVGISLTTTVGHNLASKIADGAAL